MSTENENGLKFLQFDDPEKGVLAYSVDGGKINADTANLIWERIDKAKETNSKIAIYCELNGMPSASAGLIVDKIKRLGAIFSTIERMAIVGDQSWLNLYSKVVDPITSIEIRNFPTNEKEQAQEWVLS